MSEAADEELASPGLRRGTVFLTAHALCEIETFKQECMAPVLSEQDRLGRYLDDVGQLSGRVNTSQECFLIRSRKVQAKKQLLALSLDKYQSYALSRDQLLAKLLRVNGIAGLQADAERFGSLAEFMRDKHQAMLQIAHANELRQASLRQDIQFLTTLVKKKMKENMVLSQNIYSEGKQPSSARLSQRTCSVRPPKRVSKLRILQTTPLRLAQNKPKHRELSTTADKRQRAVSESKFRKPVLLREPTQLSVHPLLEQCFRAGFKLITALKSQGDIRSGLGLQLARHNREEKPTPGGSIGSMVFGVLKRMVKEEDKFLVDWESFRQFNLQQMLGIAAITGMERILTALRRL